MTRFGNLKEENKYFLHTERRKCALCQEENTLKHLQKYSVAIPKGPIPIEEMLPNKRIVETGIKRIKEKYQELRIQV